MMDLTASATWSSSAPGLVTVGNDAADKGRVTGAALGSDGRIYAVGGIAGGSPLPQVEAYNTATNTWTTAAAMP